MAHVVAKTLRRARKLRGKLTNAETLLWSQLRQGVRGLRFRRQHPIGPYIADFACVPLRLVIEVEGATHSTELERRHDTRPDAFLRARRWQIVRVTNGDVYRSLDAVLELIWQRSSERPEAPSGASHHLPHASHGGGTIRFRSSSANSL